jgi:hypothetical protein
MVRLDHGLIRSARRLITGANIHRAKEMIIVYEQAVLLHNKKSPGHVVYQNKYERQLRDFTERECAAWAIPINSTLPNRR